jgi:formylglycine-generating enzyme required for sulfatase activity
LQNLVGVSVRSIGFSLFGGKDSKKTDADSEQAAKENESTKTPQGGVQADEEYDCALNKPPNPSDVVGNHRLNVEQLAGGMWEWTADYYAETYADGDGSSNPTGPKTGTRRVQRGGGWMSSSPLDFRGAARASLLPDTRMPDVGFRCARSL